MRNNKQVQAVPVEWGNSIEHRRKLAQAINNLLQGKIFSVGEVTLAANAASTTVDDRRIGNESIILFMPLTANAARATGWNAMHVKTTDFDPLNLQFTINHANNAQTDRDYRYVILG